MTSPIVPVELDSLDKQLMARLKENARASVVELAKRLGVPRTTVAKRLERLEARKIILGYTVRPNHQLLGSGQVGFVMVQTRENLNSLPLGEKIAPVAGVEEVYLVAGEWDLIVKVRAPTFDALFEVLKDVQKQGNMAKTHTIACFRAIRESL